MKEDLELSLVKKYPILYQNYKGDMRKTCMAWGMECGDGWFKLLDELSKKLESYGVIAAQVKEKWGGLSFYLESCNEDVFDKAHEAVGEAESLSYKTCEKCGKPGKRRSGGWIIVLCDNCDIKRNKNKIP